MKATKFSHKGLQERTMQSPRLFHMDIMSTGACITLIAIMVRRNVAVNALVLVLISLI